MPVVTYPGLGGVLDVTSTYTIYYENQAAGRTFVFPVTAKETYAGTTQYGRMYLEGCGHFELNGGISHQSQFTPILNQSGAGELWVTNFTSTITGFQVYSSDSTKRNIHLAKGSYLRTNNRAYGQFVFATDTRIDGEGYIRMADSSNLSKGNYPLNVSTANIRVDIDTKLQLETSPAAGKTAADYSCDFTGSTGAILALNYPENDIPGDVRVKYIGLEVAKIGAPGEASSLGVGTNIRLRRGTLRLKGDGETTTRPIFFESTEVRGGGFVYLGTNKWTVASEFTFEEGAGHAPCTCSSVEPEGVLEIMNPFVDNTTTAVTSDGLTMANPGRGTVIWHGANTFRNWWRFGETGQSGFKSKVIIPPDASFTCVRPGKNLLFYKCDVVVQGGVETAAPDLNFLATYVYYSDNTLTLLGKRNVLFGELDHSNGATILISRTDAENQRCYVDSLSPSSGQVSYLKINGHPTVYAADHEMFEAKTEMDTVIDAADAVIPDNSTKRVGLVGRYADAQATLAADVTTVKRLIDTDAGQVTVRIGESQTLKTTGLAVNPDAGGMKIGETSGQGKLMPSSDTLELIVPEGKTIDINADLEIAQDTKFLVSGDGLVNLRGNLAGMGDMMWSFQGNVGLYGLDLFTGTFTADNRYGQHFTLWNPQAFADRTPNVWFGRMTAPIEDANGAPLWTKEGVYDLANRIAAVSNGLLTVCSATNLAWTLETADVTGDTFVLGHEGANRLDLTLNAAGKAVTLGAYEGTMNVTGGDGCDVTIRGGYVGSDDESKEAVLTLENVKGTFGKATDAVPSEPILVGPYGGEAHSSGYATNGTGRLVLRNVRLGNGMTNPEEHNAILAKNILVATVPSYRRAGRGIVEIEGEGTVVTARMSVADSGFGSVGAVYHKAGTFVNTGMTKEDVNTARLGTGGHGYYELKGGHLDIRGQSYLGAGQGQLTAGLFHQYGGTVLMEKEWMVKSDGTRTLGGFWGVDGGYVMGHTPERREHLFAHASVYIEEGTFVHSNNCYVGMRNGGHAEFNVCGPNALLDFPASSTEANVNRYFNNSSADCFVNFMVRDGGTFAVSVLRSSNGQGGGTKANNTNDMLRLSFDGGTLRARSSVGSIFYATDDGTGKGVDVVIYKGGLTVDTAGFNVSIAAPIVSPVGLGVASVALPTDPEFQALDLIAPPGLVIAGGRTDGVAAIGRNCLGATGVVRFDSANKAIRDVRITTPGFGFQMTPKAYFRYAGREYEGAVTLAENDRTGPLTKTGAGTLTLSKPNTYEGVTYVEGGELAQGVDYAIPSNAAVVVRNGGKLNFKVRKAHVKSLTVEPGGQLSNVGNVTFGEGALVFTAGQTVAFGDTSVVFPSLSVDIANAAEVAAGTKAYYTLATFLSEQTGTFTLCPSAQAILGDEWSLRLTAGGKRLRLRRDSGTMVILR